MAKKFVDPEDEILDGMANVAANFEKACRFCKHFNLKRNNCSAFPNGIPHDIRYGQVLHTKPMFKQKNNIIFEPKQ